MSRSEAECEVSETKPEEIPELSAILRAGWLAAYPSSDLGLTTKAVAAHTSRFLDPDSQAGQKEALRRLELRKWTARVEGRIVGFADVNLEDNEILGMYVDPELHGSGVADRLIEVALSSLDPDRPIVLSTASHNGRAIAFYERHEFQLGSDGDAYRVGEIEMPTVELVRRPRPQAP